MKPEYRFEYRIVDATNDETVLKGSTYVSSIDTDGGCESIEMELFSGLRAFNNKVREKYELENYESNS